MNRAGYSFWIDRVSPRQAFALRRHSVERDMPGRRVRDTGQEPEATASNRDASHGGS